MLIAALAVAIGLLAAPATAATGHLEHLRPARHDMLVYTWNNVWKHAGEDSVYFSGWTKFDRRKYGVEWYPTVKIVHPCFPPHCVVAEPDSLPSGVTMTAAKRHVTATLHYSPRFVRRHFGSRTSTTVMPASSVWYKPWTWCWSCILKRIYNNIVSPCWKGAVGFTGQRFATGVVRKLMTDGAAMGRLAGPDGWAATAISGCLFGILFSKVTSSTPQNTHAPLDRRLS